jgi:hypothetical protein
VPMPPLQVGVANHPRHRPRGSFYGIAAHLARSGRRLRPRVPPSASLDTAHCMCGQQGVAESRGGSPLALPSLSGTYARPWIRALDRVRQTGGRD